MNEKKAINESSFYYSAGMLRMLLSMKLITQEEYSQIVEISAKHYDTEILCV